MTAVASVSGTSFQRKRKNDEDPEVTGFKFRRGQYYYILESESEVGTSDEDTESILSIQNKSTDFAKDTSDTSTKPSSYSSGGEFEVLSLSDQDYKLPFNSYSSANNSSDSWERMPSDTEMKEMRDNSDECVSADYSSAASDLPVTKDSIHGSNLSRYLKPCLKCKTQASIYVYCDKCYKVRKDFFPPRPKPRKKRSLKPSFKKKNSKESSKLPLPLKELKNDSFAESSSACSQELMLTLETPNPALSTESKNSGLASLDGVCNICYINPKNGAFVHCRWVHVFCCYQCSQKIWFDKRCCPLCNTRVNKICRLAVG